MSRSLRGPTALIAATSIPACASLLGIDESYVHRRPDAGAGTAESGTAGTGGAGWPATGGADAGGSGGTSFTDGASGSPVDSGTSGDAGAAGDDSGGVDASAPCPGSLPGPPLVEVPLRGGSGHYCMDRHEVTRAQYAEFLASSPSLSLQPPDCSWNIRYEPPSWPPDPSEEGLPVGLVDWCDASAYCAWAGKRLCGRIGGGPNDPDRWDDPDSSQWYNACSDGGSRAFPYGDTYAAEACNGAEHAGAGPVPADQAGPCVAASGAVHLSGNVAEWEDSRKGGTCLVRGGSYVGAEVRLRCDSDLALACTSLLNAVGFRCCLD